MADGSILARGWTRARWALAIGEAQQARAGERLRSRSSFFQLVVSVCSMVTCPLWQYNVAKVQVVDKETVSPL